MNLLYGKYWKALDEEWVFEFEKLALKKSFIVNGKKLVAENSININYETQTIHWKKKNYDKLSEADKKGAKGVYNIKFIDRDLLVLSSRLESHYDVTNLVFQRF